MKTIILIIIFVFQSCVINQYKSIDYVSPSIINLSADFITVRSKFEHNEAKWTAINKDSLKVGQTYYYILEENLSVELKITKYK